MKIIFETFSAFLAGWHLPVTPNCDVGSLGALSLGNRSSMDRTGSREPPFMRLEKGVGFAKRVIKSSPRTRPAPISFHGLWTTQEWLSPSWAKPQSREVFCQTLASSHCSGKASMAWLSSRAWSLTRALPQDRGGDAGGTFPRCQSVPVPHLPPTGPESPGGDCPDPDGQVEYARTLRRLA